MKSNSIEIQNSTSFLNNKRKFLEVFVGRWSCVTLRAIFFFVVNITKGVLMSLGGSVRKFRPLSG